MKVLAEITSDQGLLDALRAQADTLDVTRDSIDREAGFTPGYASKLLSPRQIKRFGGMSRYALIGALGAKLVLVEEVRIRTKLEKRRVKPGMLAVSVGRGKHRMMSKRFLRKIAPRGGNMRAHNLTPRRRKQIARKAARARWGRN
jgi:hypothetical protein